MAIHGCQLPLQPPGANVMLLAGRLNEAEAEMRRALELDPLSPIINANIGMCFYVARQYDAAIAHWRKALEMHRNYGLLHEYMSAAYVGKAMYREAVAELQKSVALAGAGPSRGRPWCTSTDGWAKQRRLERCSPRCSPAETPPLTTSPSHIRAGGERQCIQVAGQGSPGTRGTVQRAERRSDVRLAAGRSPFRRPAPSNGPVLADSPALPLLNKREAGSWEREAASCELEAGSFYFSDLNVIPLSRST